MEPPLREKRGTPRYDSEEGEWPRWSGPEEVVQRERPRGSGSVEVVLWKWFCGSGPVEVVQRKQFRGNGSKKAVQRKCPLEGKAHPRQGETPTVSPLASVPCKSTVKWAGGLFGGFLKENGKKWKQKRQGGIAKKTECARMHAVASIAQSVEQAAVNRWVLGSSPCRGAFEALVGFHPQEPSFLGVNGRFPGKFGWVSLGKCWGRYWRTDWGND